jgi:hypothetical protein
MPHLNPWVLSSSILLLVVGVFGVAANNAPVPPAYHGANTFWPYQCIDTMKASRDDARNWASKPDLKDLIDKQMSTIAATGANCVAIDTPYDAEFLPVLQTWVAGARAHHLRVWFRGNFSGWEGWFNYPKGMAETELLTRTKAFIVANPNLFEDNDIFTAAPEAENGGPFNQVEPGAYQAYRSFLIKESDQTDADFNSIHKHVVTNWSSMNGGLARRMLDQPTIDKLGGTVTIDHYIADPATMGDYINYFAHTFNANIVIGEWGAPIPEFNGTMTASDQASFISQLLQQMAVRADDVYAVNYWTLSDGSTAIIDDNNAPLPAYNVLKSYYSPGVILGTIKRNGKAISGASIVVDGVFVTKSDKYGNYAILVPSGERKISVSVPNNIELSDTVNVPIGNNVVKNF